MYVYSPCVYWCITGIALQFLYHRNKNLSLGAVLQSGMLKEKVAMETELHWPEMKASEDLDFHCT